MGGDGRRSGQAGGGVDPESHLARIWTDLARAGFSDRELKEFALDKLVLLWEEAQKRHAQERVEELDAMRAAVASGWNSKPALFVKLRAQWAKAMEGKKKAPDFVSALLAKGAKLIHSPKHGR